MTTTQAEKNMNKEYRYGIEKERFRGLFMEGPGQMETGNRRMSENVIDLNNNHDGQ